MIPKVINYCWFGGNPLSEVAIKCIESWKKFCPDYEIIQWNESNYDVNSCAYVKEAYDAKKWAFVSDYARLDIIYNHGGIYLDTDVELIKNIDVLLKEECFLGAETSGYIASGLGFGARKHSNVIKLLLDEYSDVHFKISENIFDQTTCPYRNTSPLLKLGYVYSEKEIWRYYNDVVVYPPEFFCPLDYETRKLKITKNTFSIHLFNSSWISEEEKELSKKIKNIEDKNNKIISFFKRQRLKFEFEKKKNPTLKYYQYFFLKMKRKVLIKKNSK